MLAAITDEAEAQGIAVVGHIPRKAGRDQALQQALDAGMDMIAHGEEYFFTYFHKAVDSLLDMGQIPYPDENSIPLAAQMSKEAGVYVTPNLSFVAMTRKQLDSLETVFSDPEIRYFSKHVPKAEPFGIIKVGQQANLILVEGSPLENIRNISNIKGVMIGGRWFTSEELKEMREKNAVKH